MTTSDTPPSAPPTPLRLPIRQRKEPPAPSRWLPTFEAAEAAEADENGARSLWAS